jgi:putative phosphoribosyl transferase
MIFEDRVEAGRQLAEELGRYRSEPVVVLGLPRGGVPVAAEVARALRAPLDVLVVRKLGAPGMPELAVGAIAEGGVVHVSPDAIASLALSHEDVVAVAEREAAELDRRVRRYRGARPITDLHGRTALVVDDGVATGRTAIAAARAARELGAARVVLAAPVVAPGAVEELRREVDDLVYVEAPDGFFAVGAWYRSFPQTSDEEVMACLERAGRASAHATRPGEGHEEEAHEGHVSIPVAGAEIAGCLAVPAGARGVVVFAHGTGSSRKSPRNRYLAGLLRRQGLATLLVDLGEPGEAPERQAGRLLASIRWLRERADTGHLRAGLLGSSTGGAAALLAAAAAPGLVGAVVGRSARCDLVGEPVLRHVVAPVLLLVGERDPEVRRACEVAAQALPGRRSVVVVPGASHLFEEPGALDLAARHAGRWLLDHLQDACGRPRTA